jgi:hypothetical protein
VNGGLELLQLAYRGKVKLTPQQARCAIESLPYETPKLSATAVTHMNGQDFATALERAIERSQRPVPLLNGPAPELPAEELKRPFPNYRNNFRRY